MLNDSEKAILTRSWRLVLPIFETAADLFYRRLFELDPSLRSLFPEDMTAQKRKLMLNLAVTLAERGLSVLLVDADPLGGLGESLTYRVREAHGLYEMLRGELMIGAAIIQTRIRSLRIVPASHWPADDAKESWRFPNARWAPAKATSSWSTPPPTSPRAWAWDARRADT